MLHRIPIGALLFAHAVQPALAKNSPADIAIQKAIDLLKGARGEAKDGGQKSKLTKAIEGLDTALKAAPENSVDLRDFLDNTEDYKGKTVTLKLQAYLHTRLGIAQSLKDMAGDKTVFFLMGPKGVRVSIRIMVPKGLKNIPRAAEDDDLIVTFKSSGKLDPAGDIISIKRP